MRAKKVSQSGNTLSSAMRAGDTDGEAIPLIWLFSRQFNGCIVEVTPANRAVRIPLEWGYVRAPIYTPAGDSPSDCDVEPNHADPNFPDSLGTKIRRG